MATLALAKKLGIIETIWIEGNEEIKQLFDYLFVLDFESTCWNKGDNVLKFPPEIIEFPVVLFDVKQQKIVGEFHQFVMPMENPRLSEFCKNFTGITQQQVDNGVPMSTSLLLFQRWLKQQLENYQITFDDSQNKTRAAFVTWTDWDLQNCLKNECKRKRVAFPEYFKSWIDLRLLYKEHYGRKLNGLKKAVEDTGLEFEGREHCGLHDARNTAYLAGKMILDGVVLKLTKSIS